MIIRDGQRDAEVAVRGNETEKISVCERERDSKVIIKWKTIIQLLKETNVVTNISNTWGAINQENGFWAE